MMVSYVQLEWWTVLVRLPLVAVKRLVLHVKVIKVAIVPGFHLFPFRTEKLSPAAPFFTGTGEYRQDKEGFLFLVLIVAAVILLIPG